MPILARRMGAVIAAQPANPASGWLDRLDLWLLQNLGPQTGAALSVVTGSPNASGTLSDGQKSALIQQEADQLVKAGMDPQSAIAQATADVTGVLVNRNADPSQAGWATTFQGPVDTALTRSPMPSGTIYDVVTGAGQPPDKNPPSWLSQNWMWVVGFGIIGAVLYNEYA